MSVPDIYWVTVDEEAIQTVKTGTVPYIKKNERPLFIWSAHDADADPMTFDISCWWYGRRDSYGNPTIVPVLIFQRTGLSLAQYRPKEDEKLSFLDADDVGGDYYVVVTAKDDKGDSIDYDGYFRVNQPPLVPTGLRVD